MWTPFSLCSSVSIASVSSGSIEHATVSLVMNYQMQQPNDKETFELTKLCSPVFAEKYPWKCWFRLNIANFSGFYNGTETVKIFVLQIGPPKNFLKVFHPK